ncbi:hypothetical protein HAX54_036284 [Datura stramonium]|uniref:Cytochrome P450 n=1 Tax=Datura stramonium TaxID=4076 RepID=A0ABS8RMA5_DATST|nr:hypothetical protein [Datura stramonium]
MDMEECTRHLCLNTKASLSQNQKYAKKILMDDDNFELGMAWISVKSNRKKSPPWNYKPRTQASSSNNNISHKGKHALCFAREVLVKIFQSVLDERKVMNMKDKSRTECNDMVMKQQLILQHGQLYTWNNILEEQEIVKRRMPDSDEKLSYDEIRQMKYLTKVIDETLRCSNVTLAIYRNAKRTINMNGYTIPKGWKDDETKPFSAFLPFGAGPRLCPGAELARLEVSADVLIQSKRVAYLPIPSPTDNCLARLKGSQHMSMRIASFLDFMFEP